MTQTYGWLLWSEVKLTHFTQSCPALCDHMSMKFSRPERIGDAMVFIGIKEKPSLGKVTDIFLSKKS